MHDLVEEPEGGPDSELWPETLNGPLVSLFRSGGTVD